MLKLASVSTAALRDAVRNALNRENAKVATASEVVLLLDDELLRRLDPEFLAEYRERLPEFMRQASAKATRIIVHLGDLKPALAVDAGFGKGLSALQATTIAVDEYLRMSPRLPLQVSAASTTEELGRKGFHIMISPMPLVVGGWLSVTVMSNGADLTVQIWPGM